MATGPRLLSIGDLGLDIVIRVPALPGRDQKVGGKEVARGAGGMAANVAVGACRLGTSARLIGAVGEDATGREALAHLSQEGVELSHVARRSGAATFYCVILIDSSGEKALVRAAQDTFLPDPADLVPEAFEGIAHVHFIHPDPALLGRGLGLAHGVGATVSLDLEAADIADADGGLSDLLPGLDTLFLSRQSRRELERRIGPLDAHRDLLVVTTKGADGADLHGRGLSESEAGHKRAVADTLGAGDAFAAAFLHFQLAGAAPGDALRCANAAAALSTRAHGAQPGLARPAEITDLLLTAEATLA